MKFYRELHLIEKFHIFANKNVSENLRGWLCTAVMMA